MAIPVRTYNLNFPSLAPGTNNAAFGSNAVATGKAGAVGNATGAAATVPQRSNQVVRGQQTVGVTPQQRAVNGRPVGTPVQTTAAPVARNQTMAAPVMKNAAMKTPAAPAKPSAAPVVRQATAVPAPTAAKPATAGKKPANAKAATTTAK